MCIYLKKKIKIKYAKDEIFSCKSMKITQNAYFPNGFSEFLHFNQNISEQKISLILQHIVKHIPQILE